MADRRTGRSSRALLAAAAVPTLAVLVAVAAFAGAGVIAVYARGGGIFAFMAAGVLLASTWQLVGGRSARRTPPAGAPVGAGALRELAADECRALGVPLPDELRLTPGRELEVHRDGSARVLVVGLAALAEHGPEVLRLGVADAVAIDGDDEHRRLTRMREGLIARALAIGDNHPVSSAPWRWLANAAARRLDAAVAERVRAAGGRLEARIGADVAATRRELFDTYWTTAVLLGLRAGFRPPIAEGWRRTLETEEPAALTLLDEPLDALEARVLGAADRDRARELVPVSWERFGEAVLLPWARERVAGAGWLAEWQLGDAADLAATAEDARQVEMLGFAVLVALADEGWSVEFEPPVGVSATGEDVTVDPLALVYGVTEGAFEPAEWRAFTTTAEIAHAPLGPRVDAAAADHELARLPVARPETTLELTLRGSQRLRRRTLAVVAPMLLLALPVAMASVAAAAGNASITTTGRLVLAGIGVALAGGIGWWARLRLRLAFARGRLVLDATTMRIEHAGLLRRSYELPRSLLRAAVGDPEGGRDPLGRPARFMLTTTPWDDPGDDAWLWAAGETPVMPFLGVEIDVPNLVLVFEHPLAGPAARFGAGHAPLPREAIGGLMLAVEAPADLEQSLTALGFGRSLTRADLNVIVAAIEGDFSSAG
jgi:hypothetical protein